MKSSTRYHMLLGAAVTLYFAISKLIFDKVYSTSKVVVDELFHLPQGKSFCYGNFSYWDPKITTLPGLHLTSTLFLGYFFPCNTYNLRFINLLASCVNLILFSSILKFIYVGYNESHLKIIVQAISLTILPPLYFFSHVYYTDTLSLSCLLMFLRLALHYKGKWLLFIFGTLSVIMRQTNVVWVALVLGHKVIDILIKSSRVFGNRYLTRTTLSKRSIIATEIDASKLKRHYNFMDVIIALKFHFSTFFNIAFKFMQLHELFVLIQLKSIIITFAIFLYINGSLVVGDKRSHQVTVHFSQLFYFLIFYGVFGLPYVLAKFKSTVKMIFNNKVNILIVGTIMACIVFVNTVVHPYLLADNRHYTFYIWNRWFGKYNYGVYAAIPVYIFLLFNLYENLKDQNCVTFLFPYCICVFFALSLQRLVEVRYFLVPYIILRLRFFKPSVKIIVGEFLWYLLINAVTFYIFFTKEIIWENFSEVQRLIW